MEINFDTALLANSKGCNIISWRYYTKDDKEIHFNSLSSFDMERMENNNYLQAPKQSDLQKYLREKHNIHIWIIPLNLSNYSYNYFKDGGYTFSKDGFISYEDALEEVLITVLNLIPNAK